MQDSVRIDLVMEALRRAWERRPELQLGQLLVLAAGSGGSVLGALEDGALIHALDAIPSVEIEEVLLGPEHDEALFERIEDFVRAAGGRIGESSFTLGGSQELRVYEIVLREGRLNLTAETYVGLSLRGPAELVRKIRDAVRNS